MGIMQKQFADLITFTRASAGGYRNWQGAYTMAAANEQRIDHDPASVSLSTATVTLGAGQHTFTTTHAYQIGEWLRASADANNWMVGRVVATGEGDVTIEVTAARVRGSGTYSSWTLIVRLGLLIEEQRTNLFINSTPDSDIPGTSRIVSGEGFAVTKLADGLPSPVGNTAVRYEFTKPSTGVSGYALVGGNLSVQSTGVEYRHSIYARCVSGTASVVYYSETAGTNIVVTLGSEWVRLDRLSSRESGSNFYRWFGFNHASIPAGTVQIELAGQQLEAGAFPTSYIPTAGAQVTRAASDPLLQTLSPWLNQSAGTFIIEHDAVAGRPLLSSGETLLASSGGAGRTVLAYDATGSYVSQNGGEFIAGPPLTFGDSLRLMRSATQWANAHCKALRYYPRRLTLAEVTA